MAEPKISVLIPMYNRRHYISDAVDSALRQTFQDFEIIIRDNCSTDGSFEFVQEKYAAEISSGKIKLLRNEENLGEFGNTSRLFKDATGKYIQILHSDDVLLPHALAHLYEVAEKTGADVVHESYFLNSPPDGTIKEGATMRRTCWEKNPANKITLMSNVPLDRFNEWIGGGTFIDTQYNLFSRKFIIDNEIIMNGGHRVMALWWIMLAKVLVKTPVMCYIRRDDPESQGNTQSFPPEKIEKFISDTIETMTHMDRMMSKINFFNANDYFKYLAKAHWLGVLDDYSIKRRKVYQNGITPEMNEAAARAFKKYFGDDYFYPLFLFNWLHVIPYNKNINLVTAPPQSAV